MLMVIILMNGREIWPNMFFFIVKSGQIVLLRRRMTCYSTVQMNGR
ncbi:hypothetical protein NMG60_11037008 [Bertholletia excelsa]